MDNSILWTPNKKALSRALGRKESANKYFRNTSSAFIKKPAVRKYVLEKYNYRCAECGSDENLQIDHIVSVYLATKENIYFINSLENLQALCGKCNAGKSPN